MTAPVTNTPKLTGQALIDYVNKTEVSIKSKTYQCLGAGYVRENGSPAFVDFYEALLDAKKEAGLMTTNDQSDADWYDELSQPQRELYDAIEDMCPEFTKFTTDECDEFMRELDCLGIENAEQFSNAYNSQYGGWRPEAEFAEEFAVYSGAIDEDSPVFFAVDWQRVWDNSLRYDFNTIEFDGTTYFFINN